MATETKPATVATTRAPVRRRLPSVTNILVFGWLGLVTVVALIAPLLPLDATSGDLEHVLAGPMPGHPLGTDQLGRDILARLVMGAHNTFLVVGSAMVIALLVGVSLGVSAGFLGGLVEWVIGVVSDSVLAFPALVLVMALVAIRGASLTVLAVGLGIAMAPSFARLARAGTLTFRNRDFVIASVVLGTRTPRILARDIVPNIMPSLLSYSFVVMGVLTIAEGSLSYLGFGIASPKSSWGTMIADGKSILFSSPQNVLIPALALFLTVLSLNLAGERLQSRHGNLKATVTA